MRPARTAALWKVAHVHSGVRRWFQACHPAGRRFTLVSIGLGLVAVFLASSLEFGLIVGDGTFGRTFAASVLLLLLALALTVAWAAALAGSLLARGLQAIGVVRATAQATEAGNTSTAGGSSAAGPRGSRLRWLAFPATVATTVFALLAIRSLTWSLYTEPRLDGHFAVAESAESPDPTEWLESPGAPAQIGRFTIDEVHRSGADVAILDENVGFLWDRGGIAYLPDGPDGISGWPWGGSEPVFEPLGDGWYSWNQSY